MKKCKKCHENKEITEFTKLSKNKDGLYNICRVCKNKKERELYHKNLEKQKERKLKNYHRNKDKYIKKKKESDKILYESKKVYYTYNSIKRYAKKIKATPKWANHSKIKTLYEKAKWLESLTGLKYHVDHIVPLQGKNVCGLHCWNNLQILEASLNLSKRNKHPKG